MSDVEELEFDELSLCVGCAKHPSLKAFIGRNAGVNVPCGVCLRATPEAIVCDLPHREGLTNLLRALIRFHYHEVDYNRHFGGETPATLLCETENEILSIDPDLLAGSRTADILDFVNDLVDQLPMPAYDKGIWIYHQNDGRLAFALGQSESGELREIRARLARENYFDLEPRVSSLLARIGNRIDLELPAGERFWRARIGIAGRIRRWKELESEILPRPYVGDELGAPPAPMATAGRLNRAGVSFLYLASDRETAACEVRPHPSHEISIGQFETVRPLRVAQFDVDIGAFVQSDVELDLFHFVHSTDRAMSMPVVPGEARRYTVTQLIADVLRQAGYDGVIFMSSVAAGRNLCAFKPNAFAYVDGSAEVRRVEQVIYSLSTVTHAVGSDPTDMELPIK